MAKSSSTFVGEILHFGAIRIRVLGQGNLIPALFSKNNVNIDTGASIIMNQTTDVEPVVLMNFTQQSAYLKISTQNIDETFTINRVFIFIKPVATGFPQ